MKISLIFALTFALVGTSWGIDLEREQRIAEQIEDAILDGEPIYLKDGDHDFLALWMRAEDQPAKGAVLLMHGKGANPDWVDVIQPLRIGLTAHGWDTLSIQLPVMNESASDAEWIATVEPAGPRIQAGLAYLKEQGIDNVVLVAHSHGARQAAAFLAATPKTGRAFIMIGMSVDPARENGNLAALRQIKLRTLDLYGERDLPAVVNTVRERKMAASDAGNEAFEQREVPGADHFFAGQDGQLLAIVRGWLAKHASD